VDLRSALRRTIKRARAIARGLETNFLWDPNSHDNVPLALQR